MMDLSVELGPVRLRSPLIAASGTVGSVVDLDETVDWSVYGAAVAKSVSPDPWHGRPPPRMAPAGGGMLNGIGIQNPGIEVWLDEYGEAVGEAPVPVWGSVVAHDIDGFATVAAAMTRTRVQAIEINLSCPNLDGMPFALDPKASREVVGAVRTVTDLPIGAKLSPDAHPIGAVAEAVADGGADWLVVANTARGAGFDPESRRPLLSGVIGGYSGDAVRPLGLRCVIETAQAVPDLPVIGCGGVSSAAHVVEYLLAGASAVAIGTAHLAQPRIGRKITRDFLRYGKRHGVGAVSELRGAMVPW
ncbi:MAG: dihydroorotate dehydrogenase [Acidimicrobiia bacterium]